MGREALTTSIALAHPLMRFLVYYVPTVCHAHSWNPNQAGCGTADQLSSRFCVSGVA